MIRLGLIGCPVEHSLSPALHRAALQACGLQGSYSLFTVPRDDILGIITLFDKVRSGELTGLNITAPHKHVTIPLLDELTPRARAIGAVNTIYLKDNRLVGDNTDAPGFITDLNKFLNGASAHGPIMDGSLQKAALILGAGGAARAAAYALTNAGWMVTIAARRVEPAREFANSQLRVVQYDARQLIPLLSTFRLIVNTTPVGTFPNINETPWIDGLAFPKAAVLYDLTYNPRETKLVKQARAAGLRASTGMGMLVEQAALAFQLWTGQDIPRSLMLGAVNQTEL
jgi:shikimate dehydrogenase